MTINYQHLRILGAPLSDRPKLPRPVWEVDDYFEGRQALFLMAAGVLWRQRRTNIEHRGLLQLQSIKLWLNNSHRGWNLVMLSFHSPSFPPLYLGCWEQPCSEAESQIAKQPSKTVVPSFAAPTVFWTLATRNWSWLRRLSRKHWFEKTNGLRFHMGVSENSVPLNPMVNDHYPY